MPGSPACAHPGAVEGQPTGSRTAIIRSGRDGRVLWKSRLEAKERWYERDAGGICHMESFPMPAGDLDGDGTPDLVVRRYRYSGQASRRTATVPLDILSGRTGRHLGSAGPLHLGFDARGESDVLWVEAHIIEPQARPDILVRHSNSFSRVVTSQRSPNLRESRLTRLSGRAGTVIWDISLIREEAGPSPGAVWPDQFGDLDGDGVLDGVMVVEPAASGGGAHDPGIEGDLAGSRHPALVASARVQDLSRRRPSARHRRPGWRRAGRGPRAHPAATAGDGWGIRPPGAFNGRDGAVRWTWRGGPNTDPIPPAPRAFCVARLESTGPPRVCLGFDKRGAAECILVLDAQGREAASRELSLDHMESLIAADLTGDGRDELLVSSGDRLHVLGPDLKDLWSCPLGSDQGRSIRVASPGKPGLVIVPPAVGLDGADGHPRWSAQTSLARSPIPQIAAGIPDLLDAGDASRLPRLLDHSIGSTTCLLALPTTSVGTLAPPQGRLVPPGPTADDPRWARPLPWAAPILRNIGLTGFLAATGLALVNVLLPIALLRLAARRRPWTVRLLMAVPLAAAVPLMVFRARETLLPEEIGTLPLSARSVLRPGHAGGLARSWSARSSPSASLVTSGVGVHLVAAVLAAAVTIVVSALIGAAWLWLDRRSMPAIEHYDWSNWYAGRRAGGLCRRRRAVDRVASVAAGSYAGIKAADAGGRVSPLETPRTKNLSPFPRDIRENSGPMGIGEADEGLPSSDSTTSERRPP